MKISTVGIDLAKSVFHVHGVDQRGKPVVQKPIGLLGVAGSLVFVWDVRRKKAQ